MIRIENLKKAFGSSVILENINLEIPNGECLVIIGGSGCGKSTLLRCIDRLIEPTEGAIYFDDVNLIDKKTDINFYRQKIGMVYQHFNLFSHLNILENLIITPMTVLKMDQDKAIEKAKELLKKVGMENSIYKMPSSLSGGQKQRVSIARTLMMDPDVILFDEPVSALDPTMVDEVKSVIKDLIKEGITCIVVTHDMTFAKNIAHRVIFLAEKGIYEEGTPEQIFDFPEKPLTRQFIYRSRLKEIEIEKKSMDLYKIQSDIQKFLVNYGLTKSQKTVIELVVDEIIYPLVKIDNEIDDMKLSVLASETGSNHKLLLEHKDNINLIERKEIDELGLKLLKDKAVNVSNIVNENNKNVTCIEF